MGDALLIFVGCMCLWLGVKTCSMEEQNKVFAKYPLQLTDVKKYNKACGILIIGFGAVAVLISYFMVNSEIPFLGLGGLACIFFLGYLVMRIYRKIEEKYRVRKTR